MAKQNKPFKKTANVQEKLNYATNSIEAEKANVDQNHNAKKQSLGPNTKR
jgi:hypothetical protein